MRREGGVKPGVLPERGVSPAVPASSPACTPNTIHINRNGNAYFPANERVRLITRRLVDRGYDCGLAGKLHVASGWTGVEPRVDDGYRVFDFSLSALQFVGRGNADTDWLTRIGRLDEAIDTSAIDPARNSGAATVPTSRPSCTGAAGAPTAPSSSWSSRAAARG